MRDCTQAAEPSRERSAALASTSNELQPAFELGGRFETRSLAGLATELFKDPGFMELCDKGLNGTLQRTKDGATAESRIQELAGGRMMSCIMCIYIAKDAHRASTKCIRLSQRSKLICDRGAIRCCSLSEAAAALCKPDDQQDKTVRGH